MTVTGSSSYVGRDNKTGAFSYDAATGIATFRTGAWGGSKARYLSRYGGQFKLMVGDHTANTDCSLR